MILCKIFTKRYRYQTFATLTVHLITLTHGMGIGWVSPILQKLQSDNSELHFQVNLEDASWIGSLFGLGSLLGNIIFGFLLHRLGRKWCLYLIHLPLMLNWFLVYLATTGTYLYFARLFAGCAAGGVCVTVPLFISEISSPDIRGTLCSTSMLFISVGISCGYFLATFLEYHLVPFVTISPLILFLIIATIFPETPRYLLEKERSSEAEESYTFYNRAEEPTVETEQINLLFKQMKDTLLEQRPNISTHDYYNKTALMAYVNCLVVIFITHFSGTFPFLNYVSLIFDQSACQVNANACASIIGVVQMFGVLTAIILIDYYGRKILIISAALGMASCMLIFGAFEQFASEAYLERFHWFPVVAMAFTMFISSVGISSLTFVLLVELSPAMIRSKVVPVCMAVLSTTSFVSLKLYPIFIYQLGIPFTMYFSASCSIFCAVHMLIFLPETKGKLMESD